MDDIERSLRDLGERTADRFTKGPMPSRRVVRRARLRKGITAFASLALAGLLVIGGYAGVKSVGEGPSRTVTGDVFEVATRATEQTGSARIAFTMTSHGEGMLAQDVKAHGTGEIDFSERRSYMRFEMEEPAGFNIFELIFDDTDTYTKGSFGPDDRWVKTEFGSADESGTFALHRWDATGMLESLDSVSDDVEMLGRDEVDGVPVTHYRATLDLQEATRALDSQDGEITRGISAGFVSTDVWIDEQDLVRMMRFDSSVETDAMSMDMTIEMRLFDYGAQVDIELPDPEDVTEEDRGSVAESDRSETDGPFFLAGPDGFEATVIMFTGTKGVPQGCLGGAPGWVTGAELVDESSGEVIAVIESPQRFSHDDDAEVLCLREDHPDGLRSALRRDPRHYTLRLKGDGKMLRVPLMTAEPLEVRSGDQN